MATPLNLHGDNSSTCRGRLQEFHAPRNQEGGPDQVQRRVRRLNARIANDLQLCSA
jgi:hypothetical protein